MLQQGSIVKARVLDLQGGNPKVRPLLITTPTHEIATASQLATVAITGAIDTGADDEVPMPYNANGSALSGLTKQCVAKCSWQPIIATSDIVEDRNRRVLQPTLDKVLAILAKMKAEQDSASAYQLGQS